VNQARSLSAAALAGLVLAGCGGDAGDTSSERQRSAEPSAATPSSAKSGQSKAMRPPGIGGAPAKASAMARRPDRSGAPKGSAPNPTSDDPKPANGNGQKRTVTTRHLLRALMPSDDDAEAPTSADPASRKLWALVQRRLGKARTTAPSPAAPSTEALRRLIREAQRQPPG
jgi:hypothetical protein